MCVGIVQCVQLQLMRDEDAPFVSFSCRMLNHTYGTLQVMRNLTVLMVLKQRYSFLTNTPRVKLINFKLKHGMDKSVHLINSVASV